MLRRRCDVSGKSLNAIRRIVDAVLWVFTGTPTFFDDRRGVKGVEALYAPIKYKELSGVPNLRAPQLALKPFDRDRLPKMALTLRSIHPDLREDEAKRRVPRDVIEQLADTGTATSTCSIRSPAILTRTRTNCSASSQRS